MIFSDVMSGVDYYWPLDDDVIAPYSYMEGTVKAKKAGVFKNGQFPIATGYNKVRKTLYFNGENSSLEIPYIEGSCASNPGSGYCAHGFTVLFLYKNNQSSYGTEYFILDTIGDSGNQYGYTVSLQYGKVIFYVRTARKYYMVSTYFSRSVWNHFAFTWSTTDGLRIFLNGQSK